MKKKGIMVICYNYINRNKLLQKTKTNNNNQLVVLGLLRCDVLYFESHDGTPV